MKNLMYAWALSILFYLPFGSITYSCADDFHEANQSFPRNKWVFLTNSLTTKDELERAKDIIREAKEHYLNGVVLSGGLDSITYWNQDRISNLKEIKRYCDEIGIELIPMIFSVGYGGAVLNHNPNLAAALPFIDVPFIADGNVAKPRIEYRNIINNGGFEEISSSNNEPIGYEFLEPLNKIIHVDDKIKHSGKYSIRLENFEINPHGHARLVQAVRLKPNSEYQFSAWVKTESITPLESLKVTVYQSNMQATLPCEYFAPPPKATQDWNQFMFRFRTYHHDSACLYMGIWGGKCGRVWLDDLEVREVSPARDVIRRPGTPITVKSAERKFVFEEGLDYEPITGLKSIYPEGPILEIHLTKNTRIKNGEKLLVSGYRVARIRRPGHSQISICMSEGEVYEYWEKQLELLYPILKMKKVFLSMDEIRGGGTCKACKDRKMTMAQILGDCITRQMKMIRKFDPQIEVYIWSDMLDPNVNARWNYFLVEGSFEKSWEYVPKDLVMVAWVYTKRAQSLKFFSEHRFRTMGAPYYDRKSLDDTINWYKELKKTPGCLGIMYTTWKNDYSFLAAFGDYLESQK